MRHLSIENWSETFFQLLHNQQGYSGIDVLCSGDFSPLCISKAWIGYEATRGGGTTDLVRITSRSYIGPFISISPPTTLSISQPRRNIKEVPSPPYTRSHRSPELERPPPFHTWSSRYRKSHRLKLPNSLSSSSQLMAQRSLLLLINIHGFQATRTTKEVKTPNHPSCSISTPFHPSL